MSPLKWLAAVLAAGACLSCGAGSAWAKIDEATRFLERAASLNGPTGWINLPDAAVPESGELAAGIHRGDAKLNLGLLGFLEAGVFFRADLLGTRFERYRDLSSWDRAKENLPAFFREAFVGQAKVKLLDQDWAGIGLAAGLEERNAYVVAQRYFSGLSRVTVLVGWGNGRFMNGFGGLSKSILPGAEVQLEYDGTGMNAGLRMLLARNLILNLALQNLNTVGEVKNLGEVIGEHLLFGITYVERLW
jgi:hypothetical protein